jgi:integrase
MRQRRPGVWEVRVAAGRDPVSGVHHQVSRTVEGTKRDAQRVLNQLVAEADRGNIAGTGATFLQLTDRWLEMAKSDLSPTTLRRYEILLRKHIHPALGDQQVKNIKTIDLDQLYNGLQRRSKLAPATVRQIHAIIRRAFRQALLWGWVSVNPAANATPPRNVKPDLSPPNVEEVAQLLAAAHERDPEFGRFLHLAATTGARRGEMCALKWQNVDFENRALTIEHSIVELQGGKMLEKDTKTHVSRRMAVGQVTLVVLNAQRDHAQKRAAAIGLDVDEDAYIFSNEPDGLLPWAPDRVSKRFIAIRNGLGYDNIRLHDLRHFAATRLIAAGVPVRTVSGRLGHANPSTTLMVYSHFVEASDQSAADVLDELVLQTPAARTGAVVTKGGTALMKKKRDAATKTPEVAKHERKSTAKKGPIKESGRSTRGR